MDCVVGMVVMVRHTAEKQAYKGLMAIGLYLYGF